MLKIQIPETWASEREYIVSVLFEEFLGLEISVTKGKIDHTLCQCEGSNCTLKIKDDFFSMKPSEWQTEKTLANPPFSKFNVKKWPFLCTSSELPVLFGLPDIDIHEENLCIHVDIFGACFYMLSRYEESVLHERDPHGRFSSKTARTPYDRPLVNEYTELLWSCLSFLWPFLSRKQKTFRLMPSHDVDFLLRYPHWTSIGYELAKDMIRQKWGLAFHLAFKGIQSRLGDIEKDPYNTFDWLMSESEKKNLVSTFYFITHKPAGKKDCSYEFKSPFIRKLLKNIHERGHLIGLHGSYLSSEKRGLLSQEFSLLKQVCEEEKINQVSFENRQHFLKVTPETWLELNELNLSHDSSLGFAECAGFRSGTCYEYPIYDLVNQKKLTLKQRPLVVMDCSLQEKKYMNLSPEKALTHIQSLKKTCALFKGDFTLLWHNHRLMNPEYQQLYLKAIDHP